MTFKRTALIAAILAATCAPALAATSAPSPKPSAHPSMMPTPMLPKVPVHTEFLVEVNKKGQVVKVEHGTFSLYPMFNTWTVGNAQQMWIRHPDGTAETGLYKVTYDYDPTTKKIKRGVAIVSEGGSWADQEGYANAEIDAAVKEAQAEAAKRAQQNKNLPSLNQIRGIEPTPSPTPASAPLPIGTP